MGIHQMLGGVGKGRGFSCFWTTPIQGVRATFPGLKYLEVSMVRQGEWESEYRHYTRGLCGDDLSLK